MDCGVQLTDRYILVGQTPVPCEDLLEWDRALERDRRVAFTRLFSICYVSTVFLGLDHRFHGQGPPILFESMAFWRGEGGEEQARCSTWMEAEAMHRRMVREVARPKAVLSYVRRMMGDYVRQAGKDWRKAWRELRGKGPEHGGDWDTVLPAIERMEQLMADRRDEEWRLYG